MQKILLTGATGMLGRYVVPLIDTQKVDLIAPSRAELDLDDPEAVAQAVRAIAPDAVLHLAAETDVNLCEREPARGAIKNVLATRALAEAAVAQKAWVLYVSTSSVFGAEGRLVYNELNLPTPVNMYGRSKYWGEEAIREVCSGQAMIVRSGWMLGGGPARDHKFVGRIVQQIRQGTDRLRAVDDRYGTIAYAAGLARFIVGCCQQRTSGLCHYSSLGMVSRFEIAQAVAASLGFSGKVERARSADFPLSAPSAYSEAIESLYMDRYAAVGEAPQAWQDDLSRYVAEFQA
jgi:dTDP-4-dehydrorhamnose reductase